VKIVQYQVLEIRSASKLTALVRVDTNTLLVAVLVKELLDDIKWRGF
jgi:hypothetical protein